MMDLRRKNKKIFTIILGIAFGMLAFSFAAVPLYRVFCQATGWGGTIKQAAQNTSPVYDREMTVKFNADVDPHLPWIFKPDLHQLKIKVGADAIISYSAKNKSPQPVTGTAVYNVTPMKAGKYFNKTQCFCFGEQTLPPGKTAHMPVTFFIDPKIMDDPDMDDVKTITLSYTFYRHSSPELENATKKFYNDEDDS